MISSNPMDKTLELEIGESFSQSIDLHMHSIVDAVYIQIEIIHHLIL